MRVPLPSDPEELLGLPKSDAVAGAALACIP
jgi:hypothetical protein